MLHIMFRVPYNPETLMARPGQGQGRVSEVSVTLDSE
jgi:hypothetical protein